MKYLYASAETARLLVAFHQQCFPEKKLPKIRSVTRETDPLFPIPFQELKPYIETFLTHQTTVPYAWKFGIFALHNAREMLHYVISRTENLAEGLQISQSFSRLITNIFVNTHQILDDNSVVAKVTLVDEPTPYTQFYFDAFVALAYVHTLKNVLQRKLPQDAELESENFTCLIKKVTKLYAPFTVGHTGREAFIHFPKALIRQPHSRHEEKIKSILIRELRSKLALLPGEDSMTEKVMFFVRSNVHRNISAAVVCDQFSMSQRTLSRVLNKENASYSQIVDQVRRELAMQYIVMPELSLKSVATNSGFNSLSHFSSTFKTWVGIAPAAYRKRHLK